MEKMDGQAMGTSKMEKCLLPRLKLLWLLQGFENLVQKIKPLCKASHFIIVRISENFGWGAFQVLFSTHQNVNEYH